MRWHFMSAEEAASGSSSSPKRKDGKLSNKERRRLEKETAGDREKAAQVRGD